MPHAYIVFIVKLVELLRRGCHDSRLLRPQLLLLVELLSSGPDGEAGTDDDIAFWMSLIGEFNDGPFPSEASE